MPPRRPLARSLVVLLVAAGARPLGAQPAAATAADTPPAAPAPAASRVVAGEVVHAESGSPLEGATVVLAPAGPGVLGGDPARQPFVAATRSTVTGAAGRYAFADVAPGAYVLRVHRLGFRPATLDVELRGDASAPSRVSVGLTVVPIRLRAVEVGAAPGEPFARHARTAAAAGDARAAALRLRRARYLAADVRELTQADVAEGITLGETDLFRALQRLPGVSTRNDLSAELWTRGARWDQTRVTFDGLPLYNPLHVGGILSAVNADAVGAAFLHPGVRPASLGEGGAAVLDLRSRAGGGTGAVRGVSELSLLSGRVTFDQQVAGGRGAWMLSARRSYWDLLAPRLGDGDRDGDGDGDGDDSLTFPFHFAELAGRADWQLAPGHALEVSALRSQDHITGDFDEDLRGTRARWGNTVARATLAGPARLGALGLVTVRHTLGVSAYAGRVRRGRPDSLSAVPSVSPGPGPALGRVDTLYGAPHMPAVRAGLLYLALAGEVAPAGGAGPAPWGGGYELSVQRARTTGALRRTYSNDWLDTSRVEVAGRVPQLAVWGERRLHPAPRLTVAAGLRAEAGPPVRGAGLAGALRLAPRAVARYAAGETFVSAGVGRSFQYVQTAPGTSLEATNITSSTLRPVPLWVSAGAGVDGPPAPAVRADVATFGIERWAGAGWHLAANVYTRRTAGLALDDVRPGVALGRPLFVVGGERARGVEAGVRKLTGRWTMAAQYAFARARTTASGLAFPSVQDQRHVLSATTMLRVGGGLRLGAAYAAASGAPYTVADPGLVGRDSATGAAAWLYEPWQGAPGAGRLPAFSRLDLLFDWSARVRRVRGGAFVQLHNVTRHDNRLGYEGGGACAARQAAPVCPDAAYFADGLPLVPRIGLRLAF